MNKRLLLNNSKTLVLFTSLLLALTACGGGSDSSGGETGGETAGLPLVAGDFTKQVYAIIGTESVRGSALFFHEGNSGVDYLDNGSTSSEPSTKSSFNWSIVDEKLVIDGDTYTLEEKTGDIYQMRVAGQRVYFHKAKPLKLADLDTKIIDYVYASGSAGDFNTCVRTLKVTVATAVIKDKDCDVAGNAPVRTLTIKDLAEEAVNPVDNAIEFTEGESKVIMILTTGTLAEGDVTHVYLGANDKLENVELEAIKTVTEEAF